MKSLMPGHRKGFYWEDCEHAIMALSRLELTDADRTEKQCESQVAALLDTMRFPGGERFIDQRNIFEVVSRVTLFGSDHRPDMSIGKDGTAIEVKVVDHGNKVKQAISQALFYRLGYRFVIVVLVDITDDCEIYARLREQGNTSEVQLVDDLEEQMNIFIIPLRGR
jgi:hypothetical protein